MENQNEKRQVSLQEAMDENKKALETSTMGSRFVKIQDKETLKIPFAYSEKNGVKEPTINRRTYSGMDQTTGAPYVRESFDFDLKVNTPEGEPKVLSFGVNSKILPELFAEFKAGNFEVAIHREGLGSKTRYSVVKERSL